METGLIVFIRNIIFFDQNNIKNTTVKGKTQKIDGAQIGHRNQSFG